MCEQADGTVEGLETGRAGPQAAKSPDVAALRDALAQLRSWNKYEFTDDVRTAGRSSAEERWHEYCSLFEFARTTGQRPSALAQAMQAQEWSAYYEAIQLFEVRRQSHDT